MGYHSLLWSHSLWHCHTPPRCPNCCSALNSRWSSDSCWCPRTARAPARCVPSRPPPAATWGWWHCPTCCVRAGSVCTPCVSGLCSASWGWSSSCSESCSKSRLGLGWSCGMSCGRIGFWIFHFCTSFEGSWFLCPRFNYFVHLIYWILIDYPL